MKEFNQQFARKVFDMELTPALEMFLTVWPQIIITPEHSRRVVQHDQVRRHTAAPFPEIGRRMRGDFQLVPHRLPEWRRIPGAGKPVAIRINPAPVAFGPTGL